MPTAKLTCNGQVTIPKPVRDARGLKAGDRVESWRASDGSVRLEATEHDVLSLAGLLHRKSHKRLMVAEIDAAIARELGTER